jgi:hypothetical protein
MGSMAGVLGEAEPQREIEKLTAAAVQARQRADSGDLAIARTVVEALLTSGELRLGHDHPELVPLLVDLAVTAQQMDDHDEARQRLSRAYAIMVAAAGPDHPTALTIEERLSALTGQASEPAGLTWPADESPWAPPGPPPERIERVGRHAAPETDPPAAASAGEVPDPPSEIVPPGPELTEATYGYAASPASPGVYDRLTGSDEADSALQAAPDEGTQIAVAPVPAGALPVPRPSTRDSDGRRSRGRTTGLITTMIMGAAVLLTGTTAAVRGLGDRSPPREMPPPPGPTPESGAPTLSVAPATGAMGVPPGEVSLTDNGGSVTLTWRDPADGIAPFIVAGGRVGTSATALQTVPAGRTQSIVYGLNSQHDYCFTVTVIYSTTVVASSVQVCTHRLSTVNGA